MEAANKFLMITMMVVVVMVISSSSAIVAAQEAPAPSPASDASLSIPTLMASFVPLLFGLFFI
uniref:Arabinogalactan peptide 13-like n=1 Tax=Cucumis melo TaxID=3656 RepID=A0A9I9DBF5_CUCME